MSIEPYAPDDPAICNDWPSKLNLGIGIALIIGAEFYFASFFVSLATLWYWTLTFLLAIMTVVAFVWKAVRWARRNKPVHWDTSSVTQEEVTSFMRNEAPLQAIFPCDIDPEKNLRLIARNGLDYLARNPHGGTLNNQTLDVELGNAEVYYWMANRPEDRRVWKIFVDGQQVYSQKDYEEDHYLLDNNERIFLEELRRYLSGMQAQELIDEEQLERRPFRNSQAMQNYADALEAARQRLKTDHIASHRLRDAYGQRQLRYDQRRDALARQANRLPLNPYE